MIRLFKYENFEVIIDPEAILLIPFKKIYDRDRTKNKSKATMELAFIYYFCDPRSDYQYLTNNSLRLDKIKLELGMPVDWKPDKIVNDAMDFYNSFRPVTAGLLDDTRDLINRFRQELRDLDFKEKDNNGKPINTLKSIAETIKQIPGLVTDLNKAEAALAEDINNENKARGSQSKGLFEDGFGSE